MDAFETFYRQHLRLVYAVARARNADPALAEDLTQETFFRAWRAFALLEPMIPAAQQAWLVRTVRHLAIDHWRRTRHARFLLPDQPTRTLAEQSALRLDVAEALTRLEEEDRQIVVFRYGLQMTSREIGELLEMPEGTVRYRLQQCRAVLAETLAAWNPHPKGTPYG